jgi:hypothetical protein
LLADEGAVSVLRIPKRPSQRSIRNHLEFLAGGTQMEKAAPVKRGKQAESLVGEANREWARLKGGVLRKNRRGMIDMPGGGKLPFGLAEPFILDEVGYLPVRITQAMVGRVLPVFCHIEDKTESGVVAPHQQRCIEEVRDANGIAGVSRGIEDSEALYRSWIEKQEGR